MYIATVHSTNSWVREHIDTFQDTCLWTTCQTAGRGQAGNTWESEDGQNLLLSFLVRRPPISAEQQFRLTMATSLAVCETVHSLLPIEEAQIKWPNDIYVGDNKLCGILIETVLMGTNIDYAVIGIGLNINQTQWQTNVPNPTSLKRLTGSTYQIEPIANALTTALHNELTKLSDATLKARYMQHLYRREGEWQFVEREVNTMPTQIVQRNNPNAFWAKIADITEQGLLVLSPKDTNQPTQAYHFKQIQYIL